MGIDVDVVVALKQNIIDMKTIKRIFSLRLVAD